MGFGFKVLLRPKMKIAGCCCFGRKSQCLWSNIGKKELRAQSALDSFWGFCAGFFQDHASSDRALLNASRVLSIHSGVLRWVLSRPCLSRQGSIECLYLEQESQQRIECMGVHSCPCFLSDTSIWGQGLKCSVYYDRKAKI